MRITFRNLSRRRVALICLAAGIFSARAFQETDSSQHSTLSVQVARFPPGLHDWAWTFDPSEGRDLAFYDFGGHIEECSWHADPEMSECLKRRLKTRENARKFIYDHWRSKRLAYIAIDHPCRDCSPTVHIFIEPDEAGQWRIVRVSEESRFPPSYLNAVDVRYRRATKEERSQEHVSRILSFVDSSGAEVDHF